MVDHGAQFYYGEDSASFADNYSIFARAPLHWDAYKYSVSCGDTGPSGANLSVVINHTLSTTIDLKYLVTLSSVTIEHILVNRIVSMWSGGPLVAGPLPGGVSSGAVIRAFPAPRQPGSYLPPTSTTQMLPALRELEAIITGMHLRKAEHYTRFAQYVEALIAYAEANEITEAINLQFPYKTWPKFPYDSVVDALTKLYERKDAEKLARTLREWSEQHMLDEEANWRAIEIWSEGLAPKYDYGE